MPTRSKYGLKPAALASAVVIAGVFTAHAADITVFAAASLTDSLKKVAADYQKETGQKVVLNFGASSTLARQIEEGAPADLFFSADETRMNELDQRGLLAKGTRESRLSNSLVIVESLDNPLPIHSANDLAKPEFKHIALADPKTVPAGVYSREYLEKIGLWKAIEPKVVPTENVRAALATVESGNVEAGMVYKTDAAISRKVKVACEIPASEAPPISYPMAVLKDSTHAEDAKAFLKYLEGPHATEIFERYGFIARK
jgi:molybdate transport system substrate-binding protein